MYLYISACNTSRLTPILQQLPPARSLNEAITAVFALTTFPSNVATQHVVIPALHAKHLYVRHATACCGSTLSLTVVVANDVVTLR